MKQMVQYPYLLLLISTLVVLTKAQDRWSWSRGESAKNDGVGPNHFNVRSDVLAFQGVQGTQDRKRDALANSQGRYEVKETTTKRPGFARPQNDEFSGEFGEGNQPNDFGSNQKFGGGGPGFINGQFGSNPYGINPGNPGGFGIPFQGTNALGGGHFPGQHYGGGFGGGLVGHGAGGNGILVGPGGPTGIIGRPYPRFPYNGGAGYHPGGVGYPYGGGFGNPAYGGQPSGFFPSGGYGPGGFLQHQQPFGPRPFGAFGGAPPFGVQFDQTRQATKKIEKRAN